MVWNMFPWFADDTTSWEGHLDGALSGILLAWFYRKEGPQKPDPFADENDEDIESPEIRQTEADASQETNYQTVPDESLQSETKDTAIQTEENKNEEIIF